MPTSSEPDAPATAIKKAAADVPILDVLADRWSPRAFADRPVAPGTLRRVLEAARWAASSYNEQPWRFLVATREEPESYERLLNSFKEKNQRWARTAPVLMASVARTHFSHNGAPNRHAWHDVGLAAGNLTAQATALGLFVHQIAGFHADALRTAFGIPEGFEPVAGFALGYLGDPERIPEEKRAAERMPRSRRPLEETVFAGRWQAPAALAHAD